MKTDAAPSAARGAARRLSAVFLSAAIAALAACATAAPKTVNSAGPDAEPIPLASDLRVGVLPNGLRYYIRQNAKPEGRAFLQLYVDAGSVLEKDDERGVAHFVEHMAFNGTANFPGDALVDYLRTLGMRFGPEVNAYTSFDETVYGIEVPTESAGSGSRVVPEKALAVLDDWTGALSFDPAEVEAERSVILEEYRMGLGAQDRIRRVILPAILRGSAYAERLPIGLPAVISSVSAEGLAAFYRAWYRSDNMALVVVGDFDPEAVEASLAARFSAPAPSAPLDRPRPELPAPTRGAFSLTTATDAELPYGAVRLYYKRTPKPIGADLGSYREALVESLIDRMIGQRFQDASSVPETPYAAAGSSEQRYGKQSRFFTLSAVPEPGATEATLEALLLAKESIARFGFSRSEIDRAKAELLSELERYAKETDRRDSEALAREAGQHYLSGAPAPDPSWELETTRKLLPGIDRATVAAAAAALFAEDDLTVLITANDKDAPTLPDEQRVRELVAAAKAAKLERPKEEAVDSRLLAELPKRGAVVAERTDPAAGTITWTLSNGARVILKPTGNKNDEIVLSAMARGGKTDAPLVDAVTVDLASQLAAASGVGPFGVPELSRKLAGVQVSLSFSAGYYSRGFSGSSTVADLKTLLELLHLSFIDPRIDDAAAKAHLDGTRTTLARKKDNPEALFSDAVARAVSGGNPRFEPLTEERLSLLNLDAARVFLRSLMNAGDYTFVFAGNVDPATLRPLVERYIASLPGSRTGAGWTDPLIARKPGTDLVVRKGTEDKALAFIARYAPSPYSARSAAAAEALQEYLDIRLTDEIREKRGDVYSVSVSVSQSVAPAGELALSVVFSTGPDKLRDVETAIDAELQRLRNDGPDPAVLEKVREALRKGHQSSLQSNRFIASSLAYQDVLAGLPESTLFGLPALYDSIGGGELRAAMELLLGAAQIRATLVPETD
jgi:zinc protease